MALLEVGRLETRLRVVIDEVLVRVVACASNEKELHERIAALEERMRTMLAKDELQNASVSENPVFDAEDSDGSV